MVDRDRVLAKLDELDGYLRELRAVAPARFEDYRRTEIRRACERLIQISLEAVVDVCSLLVVGLRLGLPGEEEGLGNLRVHEYGRVNDAIVFETIRERLGDLDAFKAEVLACLKK